MARIISGMFPPQKEAVPNISLSESEDNQDISSDIGKQKLQYFSLFVASPTPNGGKY